MANWRKNKCGVCNGKNHERNISDRGRMAGELFFVVLNGRTLKNFKLDVFHNMLNKKTFSSSAKD